MAHDILHIVGLRVDCVVGILPEERVRQQRLVLDLELHLDTREAARSGRISATVDYDRAAREIMALLNFRRYRLLEMAAEEIAAMLLGVHPELSSVGVRLIKPGALRGFGDGAGVAIQRGAEDFERRHEANKFGSVEVLHETREAGLYLLHVDAGKAIPAHFHKVMRELEWLVVGSLERDGRALENFDPMVWPRERVHTYRNKSGSRATLFCCDSPPFLPDDEVLAEPSSPGTPTKDPVDL